MSALSLGLIAAMCWGFHDICVRFLTQKASITACIFTVLSVGLLFQTSLHIAVGPDTTFSGAAVAYAGFAGGAFVIASLGLYLAFERGPVKVVAPLIASYPIFSVCWAVFSGNQVSAIQWIAVLAIIAGVSLVAGLSKDEANEMPPLGPTIAYSLLASAGFAATFALGQAAVGQLHDISATLITRTVAVLFAGLGIVIWRKKFWPGWGALPWLVAMGIADGVALYCVISAGSLSNEYLASISASMFGLLTIVLARVFLKEKMTAAQWGGCLIAFVGVGYLAL